VKTPSLTFLDNDLQADCGTFQLDRLSQALSPIDLLNITWFSFGFTLDEFTVFQVENGLNF
jgi:hypothetical protein